ERNGLGNGNSQPDSAVVKRLRYIDIPPAQRPETPFNYAGIVVHFWSSYNLYEARWHLTV
ncbi:MAG: hypothetical protein OXJ56_18695, partial [Rhodospirillaceae bacterium]|nr:hypothetical protein [Rhodospirillaceae bacterium]